VSVTPQPGGAIRVPLVAGRKYVVTFR
jgi:hypothetical protein